MFQTRHATMSVTPLSRILQSFSAPISEEHGWAIIHQACVTLIQASSAPVLVVESPSQLLISDDGCIDQDSFTRPSRARRRMTSYAQVVAELGVVVYTALDFSLGEEVYPYWYDLWDFYFCWVISWHNTKLVME